MQGAENVVVHVLRCIEACTHVTQIKWIVRKIVRRTNRKKYGQDLPSAEFIRIEIVVIIPLLNNAASLFRLLVPPLSEPHPVFPSLQFCLADEWRCVRIIKCPESVEVHAGESQRRYPRIKVVVQDAFNIVVRRIIHDQF